LHLRRVDEKGSRVKSSLWFQGPPPTKYFSRAAPISRDRSVASENIVVSHRRHVAAEAGFVQRFVSARHPIARQ
jgi:hypothetical protein